MKTNEEIKSMHDNQRDTGKSNEKTKPQKQHTKKGHEKPSKYKASKDKKTDQIGAGPFFDGSSKFIIVSEFII